MQQHGEDGELVPQAPQGFHEGQVRFPLPRVLDALALRRPPLAPGGPAAQEHLDHGGLPHPRFPTDEDELARAVSRLLVPRLQGRHVALAPHQGAGRQRWRSLQGAAQQKPIAWWAPAGQQKYLVLQGTDDQAAPPENGDLLKQELGARVTLVPFPGAGHLMLVTEPKKAAAAMVSFLRYAAHLT